MIRHRCGHDETQIPRVVGIDGVPVSQADQPRHGDADQIEPNHRQGHDRLVPRIHRRGEERGGDEADEDCVIDMAHQPSCGHEPHEAQEEHERRQLKHRHHAEQHISIQPKRVFQLWRQLDRRGVELREKLDRGWEEQVVREQDATKRAGRGHQHERDCQPPLVLMQPRCDEAPHLEQHVGRREHDAANQGDVEVEGERFTHPRCDQRRACRQGIQRRPQHHLGDPIAKHKGGDHARADREARSNQPRAKLLEVIEESHLPVTFIVFGWFRPWRGKYAHGVDL